MIVGWLLIVAASIGEASSSPQTQTRVIAAIDSSSVTVGDPILLTLSFELGRFEKFDLENAVRLLEPFSPRPLPTPNDEDGRSWPISARFELRLFRVGEYQIPALPVTYIAASGDTATFSSQPIDLEVVSVREDGEIVPSDIRPPREISGGIPLWLAGALVAGTAIGIVGLVYWLSTRSRGTPEPDPEPPVDFAAEFVRIAGMGLLAKGETKQFYSLLADNLRRFLHITLEVETMERTTDEIVADLRAHPAVDQRALGNVEDFLRTADLVKFAKYAPATSSALRVPQAGVSIVSEMESALSPVGDIARG
jgi:hypothetical protein